MTSLAFNFHACFRNAKNNNNLQLNKSGLIEESKIITQPTESNQIASN